MNTLLEYTCGQCVKPPLNTRFFWRINSIPLCSINKKKETDEVSFFLFIKTYRIEALKGVKIRLPELPCDCQAASAGRAVRQLGCQGRPRVASRRRRQSGCGLRQCSLAGSANLLGFIPCQVCCYNCNMKHVHLHGFIRVMYNIM